MAIASDAAVECTSTGPEPRLRRRSEAEHAARRWPGAQPRREAHCAQPWTIDDARALYNIEGWGAGFFDINAAWARRRAPRCGASRARAGSVRARAATWKSRGSRCRCCSASRTSCARASTRVSTRFTTAIEEFGYTGGYTTVYPIKVNQQRHVVEEIVRFGKRARRRPRVRIQARAAGRPRDVRVAPTT